MISSQWPDGWRGHEQQQLERQKNWTFAQKLQWLEDAHYLVLQLERARASQTHTSSTRNEEKEEK